MLSFPADVPAETGSGLLGDVVICAPLVQLEPCSNRNPRKPTGRILSFMVCCIFWAMTTKFPRKPNRWRHSRSIYSSTSAFPIPMTPNGPRRA